VSDRPRVLICSNSVVRNDYIEGEGVARLEALGDWEWLSSEGASSNSPERWGGASSDPADAERLRQKLAEGFDALIVCHGSPYIDGAMLDAAPRLKLIGELEGYRFANRIDVEAATERGVRVVDTTHGSSLPVAEWALALMLIGLRNAGEQYRRLIAHEEFRRSQDDPGFRLGELSDRSVGLIGLGHIGRRLVELLQPFRCRVLVYDPYVVKEVALAMHVELSSLEDVMAEPDVVVCTAPLTPRTKRMIGAAELDLLKPDAVFVNVSRGAIVEKN